MFFILDSHFGGDLAQLTKTAHVWIAESIDSASAARTTLARNSEPAWPYQGITTFSPADCATTTFYSMLWEINEHHGEHSAVWPWQAIHVRWVAIEDISESRVGDELGGVPVRVLSEDGGFVILRADPPAAAADAHQAARG